MRVRRDASLQALNTLALPARAAVLATVSDEQQLAAALRLARDEGRATIPLGAGSNIVLAGDVDACLLRFARRGVAVLEQSAQQVLLRVCAGENWHALVEWTLQQGFFGLQNLALIPGTVGAAPVQNIGAYGVELADTVDRVHGVHLGDGSSFNLSRDACAFAYRDSVFKTQLRDQVIITAVDLRLGLSPTVDTRYPALAAWLAAGGIVEPSPREVFNAVVAIRSSKLPDPAIEPNAGSFFKNPLVAREEAARLQRRFPEMPVYPQAGSLVKLAAGWMIERCGWKGYTRDGVGVHREHALVLVNLGDATGERVLALAEEIRLSVLDAFGVSLVIEPRVYGAGFE